MAIAEAAVGDQVVVEVDEVEAAALAQVHAEEAPLGSIARRETLAMELDRNVHHRTSRQRASRTAL